MSGVMVETFTSPPPQPPADQKLPEAKSQPDKGGTISATVDTTQAPKAAPNKAPEQKTEDRPKWLPPEFKTPEEFAEAYRKGVEAKAAADKAKPPAETPPPSQLDPKSADEAVKKAGLDMAELSNEYKANNGKLTEETLTKLEKSGVKREMVNEYIEGQKARGEAYVKDLESAVGGAKELEATLKWAASNLSPAEIAAADNALKAAHAAMDAQAAKLILSGIYSRRQATEGVEPQFISGRGGRTSDIAPYESTAEMLRDMKNPLYSSDEAFRQKVMRRIAAGSRK